MAPGRPMAAADNKISGESAETVFGWRCRVEFIYDLSVQGEYVNLGIWIDKIGRAHV